MKYLIFFIALNFTGLFLFSQDESTCFQRYAKIFELRGADEVKNGWHDNVVITIRKGSFADCFLGKVKVENGNINPNSISLKFVDDNFEKFDRSYKNETPINIIQGMSKTMISMDEELINVLFVDAVKPKKKAYERAPDPSSLFEM